MDNPWNISQSVAGMDNALDVGIVLQCCAVASKMCDFVVENHNIGSLPLGTFAMSAKCRQISTTAAVVASQRKCMCCTGKTTSLSGCIVPRQSCVVLAAGAPVSIADDVQRRLISLHRPKSSASTTRLGFHLHHRASNRGSCDLPYRVEDRGLQISAQKVLCAKVATEMVAWHTISSASTTSGRAVGCERAAALTIEIPWRLRSAGRLPSR